MTVRKREREDNQERWPCFARRTRSTNNGKTVKNPWDWLTGREKRVSFLLSFFLKERELEEREILKIQRELRSRDEEMQEQKYDFSLRFLSLSIIFIIISFIIIHASHSVSKSLNLSITSSKCDGSYPLFVRPSLSPTLSILTFQNRFLW